MGPRGRETLVERRSAKIMPPLLSEMEMMLLLLEMVRMQCRRRAPSGKQRYSGIVLPVVSIMAAS